MIRNLSALSCVTCTRPKQQAAGTHLAHFIAALCENVDKCNLEICLYIEQQPYMHENLPITAAFLLRCDWKPLEGASGRSRSRDPHAVPVKNPPDGRIQNPRSGPCQKYIKQPTLLPLHLPDKEKYTRDTCCFIHTRFTLTPTQLFLSLYNPTLSRELLTVSDLHSLLVQWLPARLPPSALTLEPPTVSRCTPCSIRT
jgi:hypothetical protein